MIDTHEMIRVAKLLDPAEQQHIQACSSALRTFDVHQVIRLAIYRRAVQAGYFTDALPGQAPELVSDWPRAPKVIGGGGPTENRHYHEVQPGVIIPCYQECEL